MSPTHHLAPTVQKAAVLLALLVAVAPASMAQPGTFEADLLVRGDVVFQGVAEAAFDLSGAVMDYRDGGEPATTTVQFNGSFSVYEVMYTSFQATPGSPLGARGFSHSTDPELIQSGSFEGDSVLIMDGPRFTARLIPDGPCAVHGEGDFKVHQFASVYGKYARQSDPVSGLPQSELYPGPGALTNLQRPSDLSCTATLVVADGLLSLGDESIPLYRSSETEAESPTGTEKAASFMQRYAILNGSFHADSPEAWTYYLKTASMTGIGDLSLHAASGTGIINGTAITSEPRQLQVRGTMDATAAYDGDGGHWILSGETVFVGVNAEAVFGDRNARLPLEAVALGAGLTLLGFLVYLTSWGKEAFAFLGLRHRDPLQNNNRLEVLRFISACPGTAPMPISEELGFSRATVRHHLSILENVGLVHAVRKGKSPSLFLNDGVSKGPPPGSNPPCDMLDPLPQPIPIGKAVGSPVRKRILEAVEALGSASYADMVAYWQRQDNGAKIPGPDQVSYHAGRLRSAGLLHRNQDGRRIQWSLVKEFHDPRGKRLIDFLKKNDVESVLNQLHRLGTATPDAISKVIPRKPKRDVLYSLRLLYGAGLIDGDLAANQYRINKVSQELVEHGT